MTQEYFEIMDNSSRSIVSILERQPVRGLLQIARMDSPGLSEENKTFCQVSNKNLHCSVILSLYYHFGIINHFC